MNFGGEEIDPEILGRHKAVYDDLMNEIEGLDSDNEDGAPPSRPVQKTNPKSGSANKKFKVEPDDDDDFPRFDNSAYDELQKGLKMKDAFDDLEKEIMGMDSDGEGEEESPKPQQKVKESPIASKQAGSAASKQVQGTSTASASTKASSQSSSVVSKAPAKTSSASFPFVHFIGNNLQGLITIDTKFHGKDALMTLGLVQYEIDEVITPCLGSASIDPAIKKHLETKKTSLLTFKNNISGLFQQGKLDSAKYLGLIAQMKTKNLDIVKDLQKSNATREIERVKDRLRALVEEESKYQGGKSQAVPASQSASAKTTIQKKESSLSDSLKYVPETKIQKILPSEIDHFSSTELLELLKKRKNQYWNLAMYINQKLLKHLDEKEVAQKKQYLQSSLLPRIQKAAKFIENFDQQDTSDIGDFLKEELVEVTPALLHGKSLQERSSDIQKLVQMLEDCSNKETDYVDKLRNLLDPSQPAGAVGKKVKDGEKALENYGEYIEYLSKLNSDKFKWVPTPKVNIANEQRTMSLLNRDIDAKSMFIRFKGLENIEKKKYWIRWNVETAQGPSTFNTPLCDENSLQFNFQQTVQLTTKEKLDQTIENKEIRIEVYYKQMFMEKKKAEGAIPLAGLRKNNTLEGKVKLGDGGLSYIIKVREPLLKHIRIDVPTVHSFQTFEPFDKDAPVVQPAPAEKKVVEKAQPTQPAQPAKTGAYEEKKTQEPAPAAASGGKLFDKKKYPPLVLLPQTPDPLASLKPEELPQGVTMEQARDPSNPDLISCLGVLKQLAEELEKARTGLAAEGRRSDNKVVSDNWSKALRNATLLEAKFGSGDIDPEQYLEMLRAANERDERLMAVYKSKGDNDRFAFTQEKLRLTIKEIKDLEEAMAAEEQ